MFQKPIYWRRKQDGQWIMAPVRTPGFQSARLVPGRSAQSRGKWKGHLEDPVLPPRPGPLRDPRGGLEGRAGGWLKGPPCGVPGSSPAPRSPRGRPPRCAAANATRDPALPGAGARAHRPPKPAAAPGLVVHDPG